MASDLSLHRFAYVSVSQKDARIIWVNYFLANSDICPLLITFANSLDPDQDQLFSFPEDGFCLNKQCRP